MRRFVLTPVVLSLAIGVAVSCEERSSSRSPASPPSSPPQQHADGPRHQETLAEARKAFVTQWRQSEYQPDAPLPDPPQGLYTKVRYRSPAGELVALVTPKPKDGRRRPAVLWAHGGFGGLDPSYWEEQPATNDQTPKAFLDAGFVVMIPAWRGENENTGRFEMYLGEVDDAVAAVDYLRALPHVDAARVYMVGHSSGGTVALLTALSTDKLRAVVSFGGGFDTRSLREGRSGLMPFDPGDENEMRVRSPVDFIGTLRTPTWYFEGARSGGTGDALRAAEVAKDAGAPLVVQLVEGGDHFDILRPLTKLLADRFRRDTGPKLELGLDAKSVQAAFETEHAERLAKRRALPVVTLTPTAVAEVKRLIAADGALRPERTWLTLGETSAGAALDLLENFDEKSHVQVEQDGVRVAVPKVSVDRIRGLQIDFITDPAGRGFSFGRVAE